MKRFIPKITPAARLSLCLFLCLILLLSGCNAKAPETNDTTQTAQTTLSGTDFLTPDAVENAGHVARIDGGSEPGTATFENKDGSFTLYVSAGINNEKPIEKTERKGILPETKDHSTDLTAASVMYRSGFEYDRKLMAGDPNACGYNALNHICYAVYVSDFQGDFALTKLHNDPDWMTAELSELAAENDKTTYPNPDDYTVSDCIRIGNIKREYFAAYYEEEMTNRKQQILNKGEEWTEERMLDYARFSYEDIDILYSGNELLIKQHFKSPYSVLAEGELYPMVWFTDHTVDEWLAAGVTYENAKDAISAWKAVLGDTFLEQAGMFEKLDEFFKKTVPDYAADI